MMIKKITLSLLLAASVTTAEARDFPLCGKGKRINCVVDGDTAWVNGIKYRTKGIDTEEVNAQRPCAKRAADLATNEFRKFMSSGPVEIRKYKKDRHGRVLADFAVNGTDAGEYLISKGLARSWPNGKRTWCNE